MTKADEALVRETPAEKEALDWALVLSSAGITHRLAHTAAGWRLLVPADDTAAAMAALDAYDGERREGRRVAPEAPDHGRTYVGVIAAAGLLVFHLFTAARADWFRVGSASADLIVHGEPWRAVTALTLHAGTVHVLGNVASCAVFVTAVGWALGPGVASWAVLLSGAAGNLLGAYLSVPHRNAVGASTALFGAIGILGGLEFVRRRRRSAAARRGAWLPIAASLALLAMLGTSQEADLLGHLFGFLAGLAIGVAAALGIPRPPGRGVQWSLALAAVVAVAGCWALALGHPGPASSPARG